MHFIYFKNPKKYKCLKNMAKTCFRQKMIISWNYGLKLVDTWFLAKLKRFGNLVKIDRQCWYHCFFYFWGLSDQKSKMILKQKIPPQTPPLLAPPPPPTPPLSDPPLSPPILSFFGRKIAILGYFWPNYCILFILKIPRNISA